jgi:hypothetical protein
MGYDTSVPNGECECLQGIGPRNKALWVDEKGGSKRLSSIATHSEWFQWFAQGCEKRMGTIYKPDLVLTSAIMQVYLEVIQE